MSGEGQTITVRVPLTFIRRGGRKRIIAPNDAGEPDKADQQSPAAPRRPPEPNRALIKSLARAFRWQALLDEGAYATINELARAENMTGSYVARLLRLTLLSPELIEAILEGRQPEALDMKASYKPFPLLWEEQWAWFEVLDGATA